MISKGVIIKKYDIDIFNLLVEWEQYNKETTIIEDFYLKTTTHIDQLSSSFETVKQQLTRFSGLLDQLSRKWCILLLVDTSFFLKKKMISRRKNILYTKLAFLALKIFFSAKMIFLSQKISFTQKWLFFQKIPRARIVKTRTRIVKKTNW